MIRISAKAEYAARVVLFLCKKAEEGVSAHLKEIAEAMNIPREFLVQVMSSLTKGGLVRSRKGPGGGYSLKRSPNDILLKDIVDVVDGAIGEFRCEDSGFQRCVGDGKCVFRPVWEQIAKMAEKRLAKVRFGQLRTTAKSEGKPPYGACSL